MNSPPPPPPPPPQPQPPPYDPRFAPPSQPYVPRPPVNGLALAAMVVGIVSVLVPIAAPVAIVLGIIALSKVKKTGQPGKAQALTGIGCGVLGMVIGAVISVALILALNKARESARLVATMSNMRQIGQGIAMYSVEYNNRTPPNLGLLRRYVASSPNLFVSPRGSDQPLSPNASDAEWVAKLVPDSGFCSFTYVPPPSGRFTRVRMSEYIILYETNPPEGKHVPVLFADGHVETVKSADWPTVLADLKAGKNPPTLPQEH